MLISELRKSPSEYWNYAHYYFRTTTTTTTTKRFKSDLPVDNKIQFSRACTCRMRLTNLQIEDTVAMEH